MSLSEFRQQLRDWYIQEEIESIKEKITEQMNMGKRELHISASEQVLDKFREAGFAIFYGGVYESSQISWDDE